MCKKLRCFLEKFTQLTKILHDRRSRRSRQISSLTHICIYAILNHQKHNIYRHKCLLNCWPPGTLQAYPLNHWTRDSVGSHLDPLGPPGAHSLTPWDPVGLSLDPLGLCRPTLWPHWTLPTYLLTTWDPLGPLVDPLGPCRPPLWHPGTL